MNLQLFEIELADKTHQLYARSAKIANRLHGEIGTPIDVDFGKPGLSTHIEFLKTEHRFLTNIQELIGNVRGMLNFPTLTDENEKEKCDYPLLISQMEDISDKIDEIISDLSAIEGTFGINTPQESVDVEVRTYSDKCDYLVLKIGEAVKMADNILRFVAENCEGFDTCVGE